MTAPLVIVPAWDLTQYFTDETGTNRVTPTRYMTPMVYSGQLGVEYGGLNGATTNDLPEGTTNKFYTDERVDDRVSALIQNGTGVTWSYDDVSGTLTPAIGGLTTSEFASSNVSQWTNDAGYVTNSVSNTFTVSSTSNAQINIWADTDNVTETDLATLSFRNDGTATTAEIQLLGNPDQVVTGTDSNSLLIRTTSTSGGNSIAFATGTTPAIRMKITNSGVTIGTLSGILKASAGLVAGSATTTDLTEGTNLYFTTARAQAITKLSTLTTNGFVKTSAGDGTLIVDTSTYLTGNQTITLSGDITGSGTTAITTTLATVNANVGSFGSSTAIPSFTVNAKGLITAASTNAVVAPAGTLTGTTLASNVVTSSLTAVGTIGTGTWNAGIIAGTYGGTGVNNGTKTITLGGNLTTAGAFNTTLTVTALTNATLPAGTTTLVPTTGTGATGTWSISISGNAATVTTNANLTGDVTSVGNATTITNNIVSNAKFRQSAASTLVGNPTGSTANVQDITLGAGLSFTGTALNTVNNGTVTSVGLSMPTEFTVTNSPVTSTGTLTVTKANQNANLVYAGPSSGSAAAPSFRALAVNDLPFIVSDIVNYSMFGGL